MIEGSQLGAFAGSCDTTEGMEVLGVLFSMPGRQSVLRVASDPNSSRVGTCFSLSCHSPHKAMSSSLAKISSSFSPGRVKLTTVITCDVSP